MPVHLHSYHIRHVCWHFAHTGIHTRSCKEIGRWYKEVQLQSEQLLWPHCRVCSKASMIGAYVERWCIIQGEGVLCQTFGHCSYFCSDSFISPTYQSSDNASTFSASEQVMERTQLPTPWHSRFGGLGVTCWPLVPKFTGSKPAEDIKFLRAKKSSARLPSEGK
jgi:hypothetical protein